MARQGLAGILVGWIARLLDPTHLFAMEHVLFITGFGMVMFAVASRVVDGHSGNQAAAQGVSVPLRWIYWLAVLAMFTRVIADYFPSTQVSHYQYAALTWVVISLLWFVVYRRKLATPDPDP